MTPQLKRAKARVERAAMRWWRAWQTKTPGVLSVPHPDVQEEILRAIYSACAALDKLTKGKK